MDAEKFNGLTIQELKDFIRGSIGTPMPRPKPKTNRKEQVITLAKQLEAANKSIIDAQKLYEEKGFRVELTICAETGMILKWNLKSKFPKRPKVAAVKIMAHQEFYAILNRLDDVFSSKDIHKALLESYIGPRRLQPILGFIIKGMFGNPQIEKIPGINVGPGVRYRKVK
jgi:hypothetical protein